MYFCFINITIVMNILEIKKIIIYKSTIFHVFSPLTWTVKYLISRQKQ